jgi:hypothetical protein
MRANITWRMCLVVWDLDRDSLRVRNVAVLKYPTSIAYSQKYADGACKLDWRTGNRRPYQIFRELHALGFHSAKEEAEAYFQFYRVIGWSQYHQHWLAAEKSKVDRIAELESENRQLRTRLARFEMLTREQEVEIPGDLLPRLIRLCHPDRHGNSESSNRATAWLLAQRSAMNTGKEKEFT